MNIICCNAGLETVRTGDNCSAIQNCKIIVKGGASWVDWQIYGQAASVFIAFQTRHRESLVRTRDKKFTETQRSVRSSQE